MTDETPERQFLKAIFGSKFKSAKGREDKIDELALAEEEIRRIQDNEKFKFVAAALDRLSTTFFGIGVISPVAAVVFSNRPLLPWEPVKLFGTFMICGLVSYILHLWGRSYLERLR